MMSEGKQKICPRCKKAFSCHAEDISVCGCSKIKLSNETKSFLANTFYDCLCTECLENLDELVAKEKQYR